MKVYDNAQQIANDLKILKLKRDITIEELKLVKQEFKDDLSIANWLRPIFKAIGKVGWFKVVKKFI